MSIIHRIVISIFTLVSINYSWAHIPRDQYLRKNPEHYMRLAISQAVKNKKAPFGAIIADKKTGFVCGRGVNASDENPTYHAEIVAINQCVKDNPHMDRSKLTLYTTAEPCPMCQAAIVWSNISAVVYATSIDYLANTGWNQIKIPAQEINKQAGFYKGHIRGGVLAEKTNLMFDNARKLH